MSMYKKESKGYETYSEERGHKTTMAPNMRPREEKLYRDTMHTERHSKMAPRMEKSFERIENDKLYTRHPGCPSGRME
jgi:hypothetical protein